MTDQNRALSDLHAKLGYKRLSRTWAKLEVLLGLAAAIYHLQDKGSPE